jgi:gliding motility-associated lipoprotein GldH
VKVLHRPVYKASIINYHLYINPNFQLKKSIYFFIALICFFFASCDKTLVYEQNSRLADAEWNYKDQPAFKVKITDTAQLYNIYVNLRFEAEYAYSNIFFMFNITGPDSIKVHDRIQCDLFDNEGLPMGKGIGDMFFVRYKLKSDYRFRKPGEYEIMLEQNMREDHLMGVHDIGVRVEKAD